MSNFKRKVNIVESTTPPTNMYDWWYDLNVNVLKRYTNGEWADINAGHALVESGLNIPDNEIWIYAPGAEDKDYFDGGDEEYSSYSEYLGDNWVPTDYDHDESLWGSYDVLYDPLIQTYKLRRTDGLPITTLEDGVLPSLWPNALTIAIILPKTCIEIKSGSIYKNVDMDGLSGCSIYIIATTTNRVYFEYDSIYFADASAEIPSYINLYVYIYSHAKVDTDEVIVSDTGTAGMGDAVLYVQKEFVEYYEANSAHTWGGMEIKSLS